MRKIQVGYLNTLPERFDSLELLILSLEKEDNDEEKYGELLGEIHSFKGTAGSLQLDFITTACHVFEDFLNANHEKPFSTISENCLLVVDLMKAYGFQVLENSETKSAPFILELEEIVKKSSKKVPHILIIEDSPTITKLYVRAFSDLEFNISFSNNCYGGLERILRENFDYLITSYKSTLINGIELAKMVRSLDKVDNNFKIILVSSKKNISVTPEIDFVIIKDKTMGKKLTDIFKKAVF